MPFANRGKGATARSKDFQFPTLPRKYALGEILARTLNKLGSREVTGANEVVRFLCIGGRKFSYLRISIGLVQKTWVIKGCWGSPDKLDSSWLQKWELNISSGSDIMKIKVFRCLENEINLPRVQRR